MRSGVWTMGLLGLWAGVGLGSGMGVGVVRAQAISPVGEDEVNRIVHRFDFDEPENYDTIPQHWIRFPDAAYPDPAFPRFTEGMFDPDVGHNAPPSFYFNSRGRSIAYRYNGPNTRVRPGDYLITGWIRPDRMRDSRAAISAYFLDWEGNYISRTQKFSPLVGARDGWQQVQVHLSLAPKDAHFIGVTCWVAQQDVWRQGKPPHRHIPHRDVEGGAWFDDLAVLGLPHATLGSEHPGNVVVAPARPKLRVTVSDDSVVGLSAKLTVYGRDEAPVFTTDIIPRTFDDERADLVTLPKLKPDVYRAILEVFSRDEPLLKRTLTFAQLGAAQRSARTIAQHMGVRFSEVHTSQSAEEMALVRILGVGSVKLPFWSGDPLKPGLDAHRNVLHEMLDQMIESRIAVIGTLAGPPSSMVRSAGQYAPTLLDVLNEDPKGWHDYLRSIVLPYGSILHGWQVGDDGDRTFMDDPRTADTLRILRREMLTMISAPRLATVATAAQWPDAKRLAVEDISVDLPADIHPAFVANHLEPYRALAYRRLWTTVGLPQKDTLNHDAALVDWSLRIIEALWAKADVVFVPELWTTRPTLSGFVTEPTPALIAYRTIIDTIGDAKPANRLNLGSTVNALVFDGMREAVLVLWDPSAGKPGHDVDIQLGAARKAVDLWGRDVPLVRTADGRQRLALTATPVFVTGIEPWLMAFRTTMRLTPQKVNFSVGGEAHQLSITNPRDKALSGLMVLEGDASWEIIPKRIQFSLQPGETRSYPIEMRHPGSEPAGIKIVRARVHLLSSEAYNLVVPLSFELGLVDVEVWGYAISDGDGLVIRHGVTNLADKPLSFRTFAMYPGRSRQYRVINELLPGQTLTTEYRFRNVSAGTGRHIRLGLREVNGPRIHNLEIDAP